MIVQSVVAACLVYNRAIFLQQRLNPEALKGRWEFPGGKVELGEQPRDTLHREIREELSGWDGFEIDEPINCFSNGFQNWNVITVFRCTVVYAPPIHLQRIKLFTLREIASLDTLPRYHRNSKVNQT